MRHVVRLLLLVGLTGCIDRFLEGTSGVNGWISLSAVPTSVTVAQGAEQTLTVTVTRFGEIDGPVALALVGASDGLPSGVSAEVAGMTTVGKVTTATIVVRVDPDALVGTYPLRVRGSIVQVPEATTSLTLVVALKPELSLEASPAELTIARGGVAPLTVSLTRQALPGPVTLALDDTPGFGATFEPSPVSGDVATALISVASGVAPGDYPLLVRGTAPGLGERTMPVTVTVTADPIQLILPASELTAGQGSTASAEFILNQTLPEGAVALAVDGLPAGVTASFPQGGTAGFRTLHLTIGPLVPPGSVPLMLRASAAGVPEATAAFVLRVTGAGITVSLVPSTVVVAPGGTASAELTIVRTAFAGPVQVTADPPPAGVTVTISSPTVTGTTTDLLITASAQAAEGEYVVPIRAAPVGLAPEAAQVVLFGVAVRMPTPGAGNVVLDWSRCTPPPWVAGQDGAEPWVRLLPVGGIFRFDLAANRGGLAWSQGGNAVHVRHLTRAELTAGPIDFCPPQSAPTKSVSGTGAHPSLLDPAWSYSLGGGIAGSSGGNPDFVIAGIREGTHDLVVSRLGATRILIRRDLDLPDGASLGVIDLVGPESFGFQAGTLQIGQSGGLEPGGTTSGSMRYLTTAACTVNPLHDVVAMRGVPPAYQRPDDFHMMTVRWSTPASGVSATEVFHLIGARTITLPPMLAVPSVSVIPGTHARLRAEFPGLTSAYNGMIEFQYSGGSRIMSISASAGYLTIAGTALAMPEFSGVAGWPAAAAIPAGASGAWTLAADGANGAGSLCVEGRRMVSAVRRGSF